MNVTRERYEELRRIEVHYEELLTERRLHQLGEDFGRALATIAAATPYDKWPATWTAAFQQCGTRDARKEYKERLPQG